MKMRHFDLDAGHFFRFVGSVLAVKQIWAILRSFHRLALASSGSCRLNRRVDTISCRLMQRIRFSSCFKFRILLDDYKSKQVFFANTNKYKKAHLMQNILHSEKAKILWRSWQ